MKRTHSSPFRGLTRLRPLAVALLSAGCLSSVQAQLPGNLVFRVGTGGSLVSPDGTTMNVTLDNLRSLIQAGSFSVGAGNTVNFSGPAGGAVIVYVPRSFSFRGDNASFVDGSVFAPNLHFALFNPNGIYVGRTATMSASSLALVAAEFTSQMQDQFASGQSVLFNTGAIGGYGGYGSYGDSVVDIAPGANLVAADGGSILLVGEAVRNQGALTAGTDGSISLVATAAGALDFQVGDSGFIKLVSRTPANEPGSNYAYEAINASTGTIDVTNGTVLIEGSGASSTFSRFQDSEAIVPSGALNEGTIRAQGVNGGKSTVTMQAFRDDESVINRGVINASAGNTAGLAGDITLSARTVRHENRVNGPTASLIADGAQGGGTISLHDAQVLQGGDVATRIYAGRNSLIRADATGNGQGGQILFSAAEQAPSLASSGTVVALSTIQARGGVSGGNGGRMVVKGRAIALSENAESLPDIDLSPRAAGGQAGLMQVISSQIQLGSGRYFPGVNGLEPGDGAQNTYLNAQEINAVLDKGASVQLSAQGAPGFSSSVEGNVIIESGVTVGRSVGTVPVTLTLEASNDVQIGTAVTVRSLAGPMNVNLTADTDGDGQGSVFIGSQPGQDEFQIPTLDAPLLQLDRAVPLAVNPASGSTVNILTAGGDVTIQGAGHAVFFGEGVIPARAAVSISDTSVNAGQGQVTIQGLAGGFGESAAFEAVGVNIDSSTIAGRGVQVLGSSAGSTGVLLNNTTLSATSGGVVVAGQARAAGEGGGPVIGVDIQNNVVIDGGTVGAKIHGRADGGIGLRVRDLIVTTVASTSAPTVQLVGQSLNMDQPGLQFLGTQGLSLHEQGSPSLASTADIVIGAHADGDAPQALDLGDAAPVLNTTGRLNLRPLALTLFAGEGGALPSEVVEQPQQAIHVGTPTGSATNFNVDPRWVNRTVNPNLGLGLRSVIGSSGQLANLTVAAGALNGASGVTLQSAGPITIGAQQGMGQLNLVTTGSVEQTGAIQVDELNVVAGEGATVALNDPGNRIGELNSNLSQAVAQVSRPARASGGADRIAVFNNDAEAAATFGFQYLGIEAGPNTVIYDIPIDRTFEGTDLANELRTDVYVHGQLSRPQLCTPVNLNGAATSLADGRADSLAQDWVKVRRGPQLTNCAGMRNDSSCAAF